VFTDLLDLPTRTIKPRTFGITMVIDGGMPPGAFADHMHAAGEHIDLVKFGWGTALVTGDIEAKIAVLRDLGVRFYLGGTLFEKFVVQDRLDAYLHLCEAMGADLIEVSNGTIPMSNTAKAAYIRKCSEDFEVISEVGFKDADRSLRLAPSQWVDAIAEDLEAGSSMVITEARESGRSGICRADGELRFGLIEDILHSGLNADQLLFEAPTKELQTYFITRLGPNVNLGNIAPAEVIGLETLRLGLRADTLMHFENLRREDDDA
jgi:phosphosulfolactate synthase